MKGNNISAQTLGWTNHQVHNCRKKVQHSLLGCSVQCRGDVVLWFSAFRRGISVTWGFAHTVAGLPWVRAALTTCAGGRVVLLKPGWARALIDDYFFFLYFCILEMGWKDLKKRAELQELLGAQKMEQDSCHGNSPANSSFQVWSQAPLYMSGRKHILWGQLGTKLQPQNAFWRSLSSLQEDMEGPQGWITTLVQERSILPQASLCFITFPPALMGTTKWRVKRQDAGESKQDDVALFRFSSSGSS